MSMNKQKKSRQESLHTLKIEGYEKSVQSNFQSFE